MADQNGHMFTELNQQISYEPQDMFTLQDVASIVTSNESTTENNLILFYQNYVTQLTSYVNSLRGNEDNVITQFMLQNANRMLFVKGATPMKSDNLTIARIDDFTLRKLTDANIRIADANQAMYDMVQLYLLSKVTPKAKIVYTSGLNSILANACKYCGPSALAPLVMFLYYFESYAEQMPLFLLLSLTNALAKSPKNPVIAYYHYAYMVNAGRDKIKLANPQLMVNNSYSKVEENFVAFMISDISRLNTKPYLQKLLTEANFRSSTGLSAQGQLFLVLLYNIDECNDRAFNILYHYLLNTFKMTNAVTIGNYSSTDSSILIWTMLIDYVPYFVVYNFMKAYYNSSLQSKAYFLTYIMYLAVKRKVINYPLLHTLRFLELDTSIQYNNIPYFLYEQYNIVNNVQLSNNYVRPLIDVYVDPAVQSIYQD